MRLPVFAAVLVFAAAPAPAMAVQVPAQSETRPELSFEVQASGVPLLIEIAAPTIIPITIVVGVGYTAITFTDQPYVVADAAPLHLPVLGALGLLGGAGGLPDLLKSLIPEIVIGIPAVVGLPPFKLDPKSVPLPTIPDIAGLARYACASRYPGTPEAVQCPLPAAGVFGVRLGAGLGSTSSRGDPANQSKQQSEASARFGGVQLPALIPFSIGEMSSRVSARVAEGKVFADGSTSIRDLRIGKLLIREMRTGMTGSVGAAAGTGSAKQGKCELTGAELDGVPLTVDESGIRLRGVEKLEEQFGTLAQLIERVLPGADLGAVDVKSMPGQAPVLAADGRSFVGSAGCLELGLTIPASGTSIRIVIGQTNLRMSATPRQAFPDEDGSGDTDESGGDRGGNGRLTPAQLAVLRRSLSEQSVTLKNAYGVFALLIFTLPFLSVAKDARMRRRMSRHDPSTE